MRSRAHAVAAVMLAAADAGIVDAGSVPFASAVLGARAASAAPQVIRLPDVEVRSETPFLPKAAFVLISLASFVGAFFTGRMLGVTGFDLVWRWLPFWSLALTVGFLTWRTVYLRPSESGLDVERVSALHNELLGRIRRVRWFLLPILLLGASAPFGMAYVSAELRAALLVGTVLLAALVWMADRNRIVAALGMLVGLALLTLWGVADSHGQVGVSVVRAVHLTAFALWLGGALFNLAAAIPAGRRHPNLDAVVMAARQLERFRWAVRVSLPTIIVSGVWMALRYAGVLSPFWRGGIGLLVPLKLLFIVALIVIFITCPLYRACSPVRGVCNVDDIRSEA